MQVHGPSGDTQRHSGTVRLRLSGRSAGTSVDRDNKAHKLHCGLQKLPHWGKLAPYGKLKDPMGSDEAPRRGRPACLLAQ